MLFIFNYADKVQALNARDRRPDLGIQARPAGEAGRPTGGNALAKRNMAIYDDKLIVATSDAHIVALDAKTGKVVWDHATADWTKGWRYTGGPFIVNGKLIQGMTGCGNAEPGGCFITGHDVKTGEEMWRVNTIAHPGDPNYDTWNGLPLESRFGASAWISGSYDPEQNLVFYGTGQPYPWIAEMRGTLPKKAGVKNNALYSDSTLAIDPDTGQDEVVPPASRRTTPGTSTTSMSACWSICPSTARPARRWSPTGKLGIVEALDRTNGQWLWHKETVPQNVVASIDPKTGEKTINPAAIPHIGQTTVNCPADPGGRGWPATAYSPKTGMLYMPLNEYCSNTTPTPLDPGQAYTGGGRAILRAHRCPTATAISGASTRSSSPTVRPRGPIASARRRPAPCCRPAAASCSPARGTAASARSTTRPARCCGRRASTTRSTRSRSPTR